MIFLLFLFCFTSSANDRDFLDFSGTRIVREADKLPDYRALIALPRLLKTLTRELDHKQSRLVTPGSTEHAFQYISFEKCGLSNDVFCRLSEIMLNPKRALDRLYTGCALDIRDNHFDEGVSDVLWRWSQWVSYINIASTPLSCKKVRGLFENWKKKYSADDFQERRKKIIFLTRDYSYQAPGRAIYSDMERNGLLYEGWPLQQQSFYKKDNTVLEGFGLFQRRQSLKRLKSLWTDTAEKIRSALSGSPVAEEEEEEKDKLSLEDALSMMSI